jgi:serine/threonine protein kinase
MWSVGCVFAELYLRKVLFGEKDMEKQLFLLIRLLGLPPPHIMDQIKGDKLKGFLIDVEKYAKKTSLKELIPNIEPDALDLLTKLLELDPAKRLSAKEALEHPYFEDLH